MTNFDLAWQHLMKMEGGGLFVHNPRDPGGATKWGITLNTLKQYRNIQALSDSDIFNLTEDEAKEICFNLYWVPLGLDKEEYVITCMLLLDQAFNRGLEATKKDYAKSQDFVDILSLNHRLIFFVIQCQKSYVDLARKNPHLLEFLPGWINRTLELFRLLYEGPYSTPTA